MSEKDAIKSLSDLLTNQLLNVEYVVASQALALTAAKIVSTQLIEVCLEDPSADIYEGRVALIEDFNHIINSVLDTALPKIAEKYLTNRKENL